MRAQILLSLSFFFLPIPFLAAQDLQQQVSGYVRDKASLAPVANVQLLLKGEKESYEAVTDEEGFFLFSKVYPGRYILQLRHLAYEPYTLREVQVKTSKAEKLRLYLEGRPILLKEVDVHSGTSLPLAEGLNHTLFTMEETQRFAATFYDPARLMLSQPGITAANDQNNQLVIHGQSPNHLGWHIEGGEVVSPTHLPNAGTFSDRASASGGGVNILSAQLMGRSHFYTGFIPAELGSTLGGAFDIQLREGSNTDYHHTIQASLLGIDLATEGPIDKESGSSYLLNYRYSTVGLLSQLGVDFGNEEISYQDFSFHLSFPSTRLGSFSVFGLGGLSTTDHFLVEDPEQWEVDKDGMEVEFDAGMGALGIRQQLPLGNKASLENILTYSVRNSQRTGISFTPRQEVYEQNEDEVSQQLLAYKAVFSSGLSPKLNVTAGLGANYYQSALLATPGRIAPGRTFEPEVSYATFTPFASLRYRWSPDWSLLTSFRLMYDSRNKEAYPEPAFQLQHNLSDWSSLQLVYALKSQSTLEQPHLTTALEWESSSFEPIRSHYSAIGYSRSWPSGTKLETDVFYQYFFQVPVSSFNGSFSALNIVEAYPLFPLNNTGKGKTFGVDASLQKHFTNDFYYLASLSLFDATYQGADGQWRNTRFNSRFTASLTAGKEWTKQKENHLRIIGLNIRGLYRGGYWYTPINETASALAQTTIFNYTEAYTQRLPFYTSFDLRLSHTKQRKNYLRTWALDIQNVTNRQNISWYYYDQLNQEVKPMYQLGIIPVIAYRLEF